MPTLALSMIVKNAAGDLAECLASAADSVDEIIVADTGSDDDSLTIARNAGAKTLSIPWENDYSKARNLSLEHVTSDWVLALDSDERLDPGALKKLPALLANRGIAGYQVTIRNYVPDLGRKIWDRAARPNDTPYEPARKYPAYIDHENVRLFRRHPNLYFVGRVHETVGWRIKETGGRLGQADFLIHHFGMVRSADALAKKSAFYRDLGLAKITDAPNNAQAHFEVGIIELEELRNAASALPYFVRACQLNPQFGLAWFFAAKAQFALGQYPAALQSIAQAQASGHGTALAAELAGDANYNLGNYEVAADNYKNAARRDTTNAAFESKLGLAQTRAGRTTEGLRKLRRAVATCPLAPELHDRLITVEVWLNQLNDAANHAERKLDAVEPRAEDFMRAASIRAKLEEWVQAAVLLKRGITQFPDSEQLRATLCQVETILHGVAAVSTERVTI